MRKTILGAAGAAVLGAGLAVTLLSTGAIGAGAGSPSADGSAAGVASAGAHQLLLVDGTSSTRAASTAPASAQLTLPRKVGAPVTVRTLALSVPAAADFGTTVGGIATLTDVSAHTAQPVSGVTISFQQLRGTKYVTVADGVTDESGQVPVSFTSQGTVSWRAVAVTRGRTLTSRTLRTLSTAVVTWAARPVLQTAPATPAAYGFRISPAAAAHGNLQYAVKADKLRWISLRPTVAGADGVVRQTISFPKAGTYLVRGASAPSATTAASTTSELTVTVG